jgi:hypothetical protein
MANPDGIEGIFKKIEDLIPEVVDQAEMMVCLFRDKRISPAIKAVVPTVTAAAVLACFKWGDIIPDKTPFIGNLDKPLLAGICLYAGAKVFELLSPPEAVRDAKNNVRTKKEERESVIEPNTIKKEPSNKPDEGFKGFGY